MMQEMVVEKVKVMAVAAVAMVVVVTCRQTCAGMASLLLWPADPPTPTKMVSDAAFKLSDSHPTHPSTQKSIVAVE